MTEIELDLQEFRKAIMRSERVRTRCMILVFGVFTLLGVFRVLAPLEGFGSIGGLILIPSLAYVMLEFAMLRRLNLAIESDQHISKTEYRGHLIVECLFPLGMLYAISVILPDFRYTLLVSPGYGFMMVLIALSVLRLDRTATLMTGLVCFVGYTFIIASALMSKDTGVENPHPTAMYFNMAIMLIVATVAAMFVAGQVNTYVLAAAREMQTRRDRDRMKRDLQIAGDIQQGLLPPSMPQMVNYEFAAMSHPADQAGGDYFDWQEISRDRIVFSLGDVAGHGVGPALVTAACRAYVRGTMGVQTSPKTLLDRVNRLLHEDIPDGKFVTLVLIDLDTQLNQANLLSAGHGPTLIVRGHSGEIETFGAQGLPLGLFDDEMMDEPVKVILEPGDLIVAVSDGFFEWSNAAGELFGVERLQTVIQDNRNLSAEKILSLMEAAVRDFVGHLPQQDDVTGLVIKRSRE